jgi:hypothetical protein
MKKFFSFDGNLVKKIESILLNNLNGKYVNMHSNIIDTALYVYEIQGK